MSTLRSYTKALLAWSLILFVIDIFVMSCCADSHRSIVQRRRPTGRRWTLVGPEVVRTRWRRGHAKHARVKHRHRKHRRHYDDDVATRETDKMAAEAINGLFGARVFAAHSAGKTAATGRPRKHHHRLHRHREKTGASSKSFTMELPVGCEAEPCQHDGDCYTDPSSPLGFACRCQPGYSGDFCEIDSYCSSEPCQNGGICMSKRVTATSARKYICKCVDGYSGDNCDMPPLMSSKENKSGSAVREFASSVASTRNPVVWPMLTVAILALLLTTFIACCTCVELRRNSLIKRYKLYKVVGLEKEFPVTSSVRLALKMTKRWLRCRCLKSSADQLQQPYTFKPTVMNAAVDSLSAHNNAELQMLSAQASEDSFWSETASQEQAQQLRELQQLRSLQQLQLLQQGTYDAQQLANQQQQG